MPIGFSFHKIVLIMRVLQLSVSEVFHTCKPTHAESPQNRDG